MRGKRHIVTALCVAAMFSCAIVPRGTKPDAPGRDQVPPVDYSSDQEAMYFYSEGLKAMTIRHDGEEAMRLFGLTLDADSLFAPAYYQMAAVTLPRDADRALEYSRKAVAIDSANLTYKSQLGMAMLMSGNYDDALDVYTALVREDPHNPVNYNMLAALYEYNQQPFTAISILDSAEYKLGRLEEMSSFKRQLLIRVKLYDKAVEETRALIADYPYNDDNYLILGDLYAVMGKDSLALASYQEALRIDSTNVNTLLSVAEFYRERSNDRRYLALMKRVFESDDISVADKAEMFGDITMSVDYYRNNFFAINTLASTLFVKHPQDYRALDLYATHLLRSGEMLAALDLYKAYLEGHPDSLQPYYAVLDIEAYLQRSDSVAKYSGLALRRFPDNQDLYLRKGYALDHMGRTDEALKIYNKALRKAPADSARSVIMGIIGDTYHKEGDHGRSFRAYKKALRYDPDNNVVLNNYAYYLSEMDRDLELALEMSSRANELSPVNPTYLDTQAWIYYKLERYEEAKKLMLQAVSLDRTGSEVLLLHYGDILYELGEYFMATVYWKRALEKGHDAREIEKRLQWPEK